MDIPSSTCPSPLRLKTFGSNRLCEKTSGASCASVMIDAGGISYTKVRGRIAAYAYKSLDALTLEGSVGLDRVSMTPMLMV